MKRKLFLAIICFLSSFVTTKAQLKFEQKEADMGQIEWYQTGKIKVNVTNAGRKSVRIKDIKTSSCQLKAEWPQKSISSGGSAVLTFTMDGALLGHFEKNAFIYTEGSDNYYLLKVKGDVVQEVVARQNVFAYKIGDIEVSSDYIEFDDASKGDTPNFVLNIHNGGKTMYTPELMHLPPYLSFRAEPAALRPGHSGKIIVTLDTREVEDYGLKQTSVYLSRFQGDKVGQENELAVSSVILPPVDTTSVIQSALAPHLEISSTELTLPPMGSKKKVKGKLLLKNTGKSSLEIGSLQVFHPAVNVSLGNAKIAPNKITKLNISVLREYLGKSRSRLRVLMTTNDPKTPKVIVNVKLEKDTKK